MSNVTYLPWVTPDPDADCTATSASVNVEEPTSISTEVPDMAADSLLLDAELERLDSIVIRKLTAGDMSSGEVRVFLVQQGIPELDALRWVERYERLGSVDDERLAESLARAWSA